MRVPGLVFLCVVLTFGAGHVAFTQTDQAGQVIAAARAALGGEARIAAVKTFIASGRTRQVRGDNLVPIEFEIQVELPDKYSRRDEFPAQDAGPVTSGFAGQRLIQIPAASLPPQRAGAAAPSAAQQETLASSRVLAARQELARLLLGMFAGTGGSLPVTFTHAGQAEAPQGRADVLDVKGDGAFAARLFVDSQTHLPLLLTWQAAPAPPRRGGPPPQGTPPGPPQAPPPAVEQRMYFADYRTVEGLLLPFRIRRAVAADTTEETTFDRFRINARLDSRRFDLGN